VNTLWPLLQKQLLNTHFKMPLLGQLRGKSFQVWWISFTYFRREIWEKKIKAYPENLYALEFDMSELSERKVGVLLSEHVYKRLDGYPCKVISIKYYVA